MGTVAPIAEERPMRPLPTEVLLKEFTKMHRKLLFWALALFGWGLALTHVLTITLLWWGAGLSQEWRVVADFNNLNEQWLEGLLFHASIGLFIWLLVREIKRVPRPGRGGFETRP